MKRFLAMSIVAASLAMSATTQAHHSFAMFDRTKEVQLKDAVVAKWEWTNPRIWLFVIVPSGKKGAGKYLDRGRLHRPPAPSGLGQDALKEGDKVTVYYSPLKNGEQGGSLLAVVFPNVRTLGARLDQLRSSE